MQINNTEINGFVIDKFNQYDLQVGKQEGICPLCSTDRKPENQKRKCASYDWERGLGTCHNCNRTFQLHTYQRKGNVDRVYVKPDAIHIVENKELSENVYKWFNDRGISYQTLNDLNIQKARNICPRRVKLKILYNLIII